MFFLQKTKKVSKNAEFHADFESVKKVVKKCKKRVKSKTSLTNMSKSEKVHFSVTFLLITYFWKNFSTLFQRIRNQRKILRFLTPFSIFSKKNFLKVILVLFSNFDCKCAGNGSKKRKIFFYECILEFNYATIKGFA